MEKILLTGGTGFFAARFAACYKDQYEILALGHKDLDVTDEAAVWQMVQQCKPRYVVHTAAVAVTEYCQQHPDLARKINVDGAVHLARAAKAVGAKVLFISSEQVFNGNKENGPYREDAVAVPDTVYGENKLEAEQLLQAILPELWIVRFTWLFGMPQRGCSMAGNILWDTMQAIMKNEKLTVSTNEFRGMTYVHEMVEQIVKMFDLPYGIYHLGAENNTSRYEIVREIFIGLGLKGRVAELLAADPDKYAERPRDIRLDTAKAKQAGFVFSNTSEAISKCIAEYGLKIK